MDRNPHSDLESREFVGAKIIGSGIMQKFLDAYFGLIAWDKWQDPNYLDKLLLPGVPRPANAVLVKKNVA